MEHRTPYVVKTGFTICSQSNLLAQIIDIKHEYKQAANAWKHGRNHGFMVFMGISKLVCFFFFLIASVSLSIK